MCTKHLPAALAKTAFIIFCFSLVISCQKEVSPKEEARAGNPQEEKAATAAIPPFNLEVILRGEGKAFGHVTFRQANDAAKVVTLDVWVRDLEPSHSYLLQRAVDTDLDGNCTGTAWLTLGQGLTPAAIETDERGTGRAELFRDLSAIAAGTAFDINFRVVDAVTGAVVLTSDCYRYVVR